MNDLISRQQAIDAIMGEYPDAHYPDWYASKIRALPSAQPEERTEKRTETHACDLISRQAAIDAVSKYNFDYPRYMERFVTELRDAMKADLKHDIEELPSAQPEWIPVMDGEGVLPEVDEDGYSDYVLVSFSNVSGLDIGQYREDENGGAFYSGDDDDPYTKIGVFVNAWMPLPKPYRGGGTT